MRALRDRARFMAAARRRRRDPLQLFRDVMRTLPALLAILRQAFREETELFFESILREDRSILDLLKSDYTFLNERLAKHYGVPNIYGSQFRRVSLDSKSERGGKPCLGGAVKRKSR